MTWRSQSVAENFTPSWFVNVSLRGVKGLVLYCRCNWRDNASNWGLNKYALLNETLRELIPYIFNLNLSFIKPESPLKEKKKLCLLVYTLRMYLCQHLSCYWSLDTQVYCPSLSPPEHLTVGVKGWKTVINYCLLTAKCYIHQFLQKCQTHSRSNLIILSFNKKKNRHNAKTAVSND